MIMKEKGEALASTEEITALAPREPEAGALPQGVIELSDDESDGLVAPLLTPPVLVPLELPHLLLGSPL
jgi:hypothetical protein